MKRLPSASSLLLSPSPWLFCRRASNAGFSKLPTTTAVVPFFPVTNPLVVKHSHHLESGAQRPQSRWIHKANVVENDPKLKDSRSTFTTRQDHDTVGNDAGVSTTSSDENVGNGKVVLVRVHWTCSKTEELKERFLYRSSDTNSWLAVSSFSSMKHNDNVAILNRQGVLVDDNTRASKAFRMILNEKRKRSKKEKSNNGENSNNQQDLTKQNGFLGSDTTTSSTTSSPTLSKTGTTVISCDPANRNNKEEDKPQNQQQYLIYEGDYHNARQLLRALLRRADDHIMGEKNKQTKSKRRDRPQNHDLHGSRKAKEHHEKGESMTSIWNSYRKQKRFRAEIGNSILFQVAANHKLEHVRRPHPDLRRILTSSSESISPSTERRYVVRKTTQEEGLELKQAQEQQANNTTQPYLISLRDALGRISADQMYQKGIYVSCLQETIYPHYGVFGPTRQDYLTLLERTPLSSSSIEQTPKLERFTPRSISPHSCSRGHVNMTHIESNHPGWLDGQNEHGPNFNNHQCPPPRLAVDVGVGTGVLAAWLLQTGKFSTVLGTDNNRAAIACAAENLQLMGYSVVTVDSKTTTTSATKFGPPSCSTLTNSNASLISGYSDPSRANHDILNPYPPSWNAPPQIVLEWTDSIFPSPLAYALAVKSKQQYQENHGYGGNMDSRFLQHNFEDSLVGADLIICNPPWIPPDTSESHLDSGIFDSSDLLSGFLSNVQHHLRQPKHEHDEATTALPNIPTAEAWLIMSNLAELLELRGDQELLDQIRRGELRIIDIIRGSSYTTSPDSPLGGRKQEAHLRRKRMHEMRQSKSKSAHAAAAVDTEDTRLEVQKPQSCEAVIETLKSKQEISLYRLDRLRKIPSSAV